MQSYVRGKLTQKLQYINNHLIGDKPFVVGNSFTIADAYLYIVLSWAGYVKVDLAPFSNIVAYSARIAALENVQAAHARMATNPATTIWLYTD